MNAQNHDMIASTMPLLTIHHKTEYRYAHPVAFGEHRIMLRPRDGHDLRVLTGELRISPEPMTPMRMGFPASSRAARSRARPVRCTFDAIARPP